MKGSENVEIWEIDERVEVVFLVEAVTSLSLSRSRHNGVVFALGTMYQGTSLLWSFKSIPEAKLAGSLSFVMRKYTCPTGPSEGGVFRVGDKRLAGR